MAVAVRKKQDDRNLMALRELGAIPANRECFDCGQRGPTYLNMTIGSFVCSQCSGVLRGLTPPHRVKSISMATFTQEELDFIKAHGNEECSKTWLGLLSDPKARIIAVGGSGRREDYREHIIDKYEKQRYYLQPASPLKSIGAAALRSPNGASSGGSLTSPSSPSSSSSSTATDQNNNNHNNSSNVIHQQNQMNLKAIQLTPPASTRTSGRHLHNNNNNNIHTVHNNNSPSINSSQTNSSRGINGSSAFAEDSLFGQVAPRQQQQQQQSQWPNLNTNNNHNNNNSFFAAPGLSGALNGLSMAPQQPQMASPQQVLSGASDNSFVADFSSADIFNANVISNGINGEAVEEDGGKGLKRVNAVKRRNGVVNGHKNGDGGAQDEFFADFDHNPIFNSAGVPMSMSSSNSSMTSTPSADRYAALKDLDEQIREIKEKEITIQQQQQAPVAPAANPNPFNTSSPFSTSTAPGLIPTSYPAMPVSATNPFKVEANAFAPMVAPQAVAFNRFQPAINGFQNGGTNMFGIGLNATGGQRSNNPFL